jgi:hypothetical protein
MNKKLILALGCLALLTSLVTIAQADAITFGFFGGKGTPVNVDTSGVKLAGAQLLAVKDTTTNSVNFLTGSVDISTGAATSYVAAGGLLSATFSTGGGVEVEVDSASCVGGSMPGVCLQGTLNGGKYVASMGGTGSFQALFKVAYVSPFVTSLFGLSNTWLQTGSDSFTTSDNVFVNGGTTDLARLGAGGVTFQTPSVPEPGTLALMGTGILVVAAMVRRKMS